MYTSMRKNEERIILLQNIKESQKKTLYFVYYNSATKKLSQNFGKLFEIVDLCYSVSASISLAVINRI